MAASAAHNGPMETTTVLFDFYGTLAESDWESWWLAEIMAARGYEFRAKADQRWSANSWDGETHDEHSVDEAAYEAWEAERWRGLLRDHEVREDDLEAMIKEFHTRRGEFTMRAYAESLDVLEELRSRGLRLAVCSNWDWDLDRHLAETGVLDLVDARVSSAWVGARKPHARIFEATLAEVGATAAETVFVGDNWRADVEGPLALGMRPVHVWRHGDDPGEWIPHPPAETGEVPRILDLRELPALL